MAQVRKQAQIDLVAQYIEWHFERHSESFVFTLNNTKECHIERIDGYYTLRIRRKSDSVGAPYYFVSPTSYKTIEDMLQANKDQF